jgi:hypothetical protein
MSHGDITGAYAALKAISFEAGNPLSLEEHERAVLLEKIGSRLRNDWIERVFSWAFFAILCAVIILLLTGCTGTYIPKCEHVQVGKDRYEVSNPPCTRTIQYRLDSEKVKAVCVEGMDKAVHCQEVRR